MDGQNLLWIRRIGGATQIDETSGREDRNHSLRHYHHKVGDRQCYKHTKNN